MSPGRGLQPPLQLGWQVVDRGDPPLSPLLDDVPDSPDRNVQVAWRDQVEADNAVRRQQHARLPVWFPVIRDEDECYVPFFGGKPTTWQAAVATLTAALVRSGYERVRIADLTRADALATVRELSRHRATRWGTEHATVAPGATTTNVFAFANIEELASSAADTLSAASGPGAGFDAGNDAQALLRVGRVLTGVVTVDRLRRAVEAALTNVVPSGSFRSAEEAALRKPHGEITRRPGLQQDLDRLERGLGSLARYEMAVGAKPTRVGPGPVRVRTVSIDPAGTAYEFEIARQIVARFLYRSFQQPKRARHEALMLLGADALPATILDGLISFAYTHDKQLLVFFEHLDETTKRFLGARGSKLAVFFALPAFDEAEIAAKHLGQEFKFVVNGHTVSESHSEQWSDSNTTSYDASTQRALSFGASFGRTLSSGTSRGSSQTRQTGGGHDRSTSTNTSRVREYIMEPEQFQQLPHTTMLVLADKVATLADCDPRIRRLPVTSYCPLQLPRA